MISKSTNKMPTPPPPPTSATPNPSIIITCAPTRSAGMPLKLAGPVGLTVKFFVDFALYVLMVLFTSSMSGKSKKRLKY